MGLDGISVNQLRITQENNSSELNNSSRFSNVVNHKVVDGLSQGQKVDPDKEQEHQKQSLNKQYIDESDNDEIDETDEADENQKQEVFKYDLSNSNKYILKIDEKTNNIVIIEKKTNNIIQTISADEVSTFVGFLSSSQGSIINRKY